MFCFCLFGLYLFVRNIFLHVQGLQAALAGGEEGMKKHLGEMSRRVTVLQVKEQVTGRKAQLLQEREAALRKV